MGEFLMKMHKTGLTIRYDLYIGKFWEYSLCKKTSSPQHQTDDDEKVECKLCLKIINNKI